MPFLLYNYKAGVSFRMHIWYNAFIYKGGQKDGIVHGTPSYLQ